MALDISEFENLELVKQQLTELLHAQKCIKKAKYAQARGLNEPPKCLSPDCDTFKALFAHLDKCIAVTKCKTPDCVSSRQIMNHWKNCPKSAFCLLCSPIHQFNKRVLLRLGSNVPSSVDDSQEDWRLRLYGNIRRQNIEMMVNTLIPNRRIFYSTGMDDSYKNQLINKLIHTICPNKLNYYAQQFGGKKTIILGLCLDYAGRIEVELFERAQSCQEYWQLIIHKSVDLLLEQIEVILKTRVICPQGDLREVFISLGYRQPYKATLDHLKNAFASLGVQFEPETSTITFEAQPNWRDQVDDTFRDDIINTMVISPLPHVPSTKLTKVQILSQLFEFLMYNQANSLEEYYYLIALQMSDMFAKAEDTHQFGLEKYQQPNALVGPN